MNISSEAQIILYSELTSVRRMTCIIYACKCVERFYFLPETITYFTEKSKERVKQNVCCKNVRSIWCQLPRIQNILILCSLFT